MKILLVSMNNHHFKRWAQQVQHPSLDLYWFDVLDQGSASSLDFTTQITGWKKGFLKKRGRTFLKRKFPKLFNRLVARYDVGVEFAFAKAIKDIQPDIVHCFEMKIAGLKILPVMLHNNISLIYSSWGTDLYDFKGLGISSEQCADFLKRVNYLITDCKRDQIIANNNGFTGTHLGVFPGNGGLETTDGILKKPYQRNSILIKGYENNVGKALAILKAMQRMDVATLKPFKWIIYSAGNAVVDFVQSQRFFDALDVVLYPVNKPVPNATILEMMGNAVIHIANSLSDGMPNALLEAMGMGAFPIQSNPGGVTEEVIKHGYNGLLIKDPVAIDDIATQLQMAIESPALLAHAQEYNVSFIHENYNRAILRPAIQQLYRDVAAIN